MTPSFVLDASLAMAWCFSDEATPATDALLDRMGNEAAAIPGWWYLEVTNVLALAERKQRITPLQTAEFVVLIESFDLHVDVLPPARAFSHLLPLCRRHGLTAYDAVYLELALRLKLPLASLDGNLHEAARNLGVEVLGE